METSIVIRNSIIIGGILGVVFLSQQQYFSAGEKGGQKDPIKSATDQAKAYLAKGSDWLAANVYSKIGGEVQRRGDAIEQKIEDEKEKATENIGEKIKNYFSGISDAVIHPSLSKTEPASAEPPACDCKCPTCPAVNPFLSK